ncbi:MAG TPA: EF-P lysine aminoacylase EpmA [Geopsychrobacteraceae bacterium]|nr:EF-P lysine aminoacylase EpmA [Geopsychrobacteraceae bacterium]
MNHTLVSKRDRLIERARIVQSIRAFFISQDYLEVETPQRLPVNAPERHIDAVACGDWDLQTSPELAMKRLLAAGYNKIFQLTHCWRDQERGQRHLPEFTMLEWYQSDCDYRETMKECERLLRHLVPTGTLHYRKIVIDLTAPFERLTVIEAFQRYCQCDVSQALKDGRFDELIAYEIEPHLGRERPTILYDYPAELAALARRKPEQPELAERFELYIAGLEVANAFSELTEVNEQRHRFETDEAARRGLGKQPRPLPEPFLVEMESLPPSAGIALGVDRLVMLLTNTETIDDVVCFTPEEL